MKSESEVTQLCLTLSYPMDHSPPGSSIHGIVWARVLEWGAIAFSAERLDLSLKPVWGPWDSVRWNLGCAFSGVGVWSPQKLSREGAQSVRYFCFHSVAPFWLCPSDRQQVGRYFIHGWYVNWQHPCEHIRRHELPIFREKETNDSKVINNLSKLHFVGGLSISRQLLGREAVDANSNTPSFF